MELLNTKETALILGCCVKTVIKLFNSGDLKAFKIGYRWRTSKENIEKYINAE